MLLYGPSLPAWQCEVQTGSFLKVQSEDDDWDKLKAPMEWNGVTTTQAKAEQFKVGLQAE
jgi:hypothetical protein